MPSTVFLSEIKAPEFPDPSSNEGEKGFLHPAIITAITNIKRKILLIHPPFQFAPVGIRAGFGILPVINPPHQAGIAEQL